MDRYCPQPLFKSYLNTRSLRVKRSRHNAILDVKNREIAFVKNTNYFSESGLHLSIGTSVSFRLPRVTFKISPFTVSFHWRSHEFANKKGVL